MKTTVAGIPKWFAKKAILFKLIAKQKDMMQVRRSSVILYQKVSENKKHLSLKEYHYLQRMKTNENLRNKGERGEQQKSNKCKGRRKHPHRIQQYLMK